MDRRDMSLLERIREAFSDPDAPKKEKASTEKGPGESSAAVGTEALAAAVAMAIHRSRRASVGGRPSLRHRHAAGPDEWTMSGRLAQVDRAPGRDPWNR